MNREEKKKNMIDRMFQKMFDMETIDEVRRNNAKVRMRAVLQVAHDFCKEKYIAEGKRLAVESLLDCDYLTIRDEVYISVQKLMEWKKVMGRPFQVINKAFDFLETEPDLYEDIQDE